MNKSVKEKWVAALRSGKYKQTTGVLRDQKGFCCLGVLCDVARIEGVIPNPMRSGDTYLYGKSGALNGRTNGTLPRLVREWAGLDSSNPIFPIKDPDHTIVTASWANDVLGKDFNEIADMIEEYL